MTDRQNNVARMMGTVLVVLNNYKGVWSSRASFATLVDRLQDISDKLQDPMVKRGADSTGITADKKSLKLRAAHKADYIGDIIQGYAMDKNDQELYRAMMFSWGDLVNKADAESYAKMNEVLEKATTLFADLKDEGLLQDDLDELAKLAGDFYDKIPAKRVAVGEVKEAGAQIESLEHDGSLLLHRMDKSINTFALASSSFVNQYKSARIIQDLGHGKVQAPAATA